MTEIHLFRKGSLYFWRIVSKNGTRLAKSKPYLTKFHCKAMAQWLFPTFQFIDKTKDRRRRA